MINNIDTRIIQFKFIVINIWKIIISIFLFWWYVLIRLLWHVEILNVHFKSITFVLTCVSLRIHEVVITLPCNRHKLVLCMTWTKFIVLTWSVIIILHWFLSLVYFTTFVRSKILTLRINSHDIWALGNFRHYWHWSYIQSSLRYVITHLKVTSSLFLTLLYHWIISLPALVLFTIVSRSKYAIFSSECAIEIFKNNNIVITINFPKYFIKNSYKC